MYQKIDPFFHSPNKSYTCT